MNKRISDFYGDGTNLPVLHPDPIINRDVIISDLCAKLDTARKVLSQVDHLQLIEPRNQEIRANARWALDETHPRTF